MWSDLSLPWQAAFEMAWEAACSGCIPIGAVIVDGQGRIAAAGRNRINERGSNGAHSDMQRAYVHGSNIAHAEVNALLALGATPVNPRECALYTTAEPCPMCAGAIVMSNVRRVCFASRDPWAGSTNLYIGDTYMGSKHMRVEGPPNPAFEDVLVALHVDFFLAESVRRGPGSVLDRGGPFFAALAAATPRGVALGERLYQNGFLQPLRADRAPAEEVIDLLARELAGMVEHGINPNFQ